MQILVIAPMEQEAQNFKNALASFSELHNRYHVLETGVGKVDASQNTALEVFTSGRNYDLAVVIGYAGASEFYHQGDIVMPSTTQAHDVVVPEAFEYLRPKYSLDGSDDAIICTGDCFVDAEKAKELTARYGDRWLCDMESAAVAQVLDDTQIPLLVMKYVSDIPSNDDPLAFYQFTETHKDFIPFLAFLEQLSV